MVHTPALMLTAMDNTLRFNIPVAMELEKERLEIL